jgi:hypothetical protein
MWSFFKDFAGPIATIVAAGAAVIVTMFFNKRQTAIAETQKNIALDKLKHDVFEKRYKIFLAARSLIETVLHQSDFQKIESARIRELRVVLDEARFFFGANIRDYITEIDRTAEALLKALGDKWRNDEERKEPDWSKTMQELGDASRRLSAMYGELSQKFEPSLRFDHLTRD